MRTNCYLMALTFMGIFSQAQTVADFESFTLAPNSAYSPTTSTPFQTSNAVFNYAWDNSFGGFWSKGFAYTNKQDSVNGTFNNLYGVKALKGYTNSATYVVGMAGGTIGLKAPYDAVSGFYITNTTYAYNVIKNGNSFSRKFGDTTGTKSGTTIPQGSYPDFFKITAKGFKNGTMKPDSAVYYLADYRFANNSQDYVLKTWEWFNTANLGSVDSITFFMYSSDNSSFGMNTPAFFALDNFSTTLPNLVGITNAAGNPQVEVYPNPCYNTLVIAKLKNAQTLNACLKDVAGKELLSLELNEDSNLIDLTTFEPGVYFLELIGETERTIKRVVKN